MNHVMHRPLKALLRGFLLMDNIGMHMEIMGIKCSRKCPAQIPSVLCTVLYVTGKKLVLGLLLMDFYAMVLLFRYLLGVLPVWRW